jgi:hypothetical protein
MYIKEGKVESSSSYISMDSITICQLAREAWKPREELTLYLYLKMDIEKNMSSTLLSNRIMSPFSHAMTPHLSNGLSPLSTHCFAFYLRGTHTSNLTPWSWLSQLQLNQRKKGSWVSQTSSYKGHPFSHCIHKWQNFQSSISAGHI